MSKYTTFLLISLLLMASLTFSSARPWPTVPKAPPQEIAKEENGDEQVEARCGGVGEEECLMRRTLEAHIDYIYTQEKKP